jgi:DNA-binding NtrC family response regulator
MRLLIVGTLDGHIVTAGKLALESGAKVAHVDDIASALTALRSGQGADMVMVEVNLDIATLCRSLKSERISVPVIACGIGPEPSAAANAIRAGAQEYVPLPPDAELIAAVLAAVSEETSTVVCRDPVMAPVLRLAEQVAPSDASVLITGESGTGKEVMARFLHSKSKRAQQQFISVNCAAIPESLLESELFGHEKGAFTGAVTRRIGKFEEANGGTLLLDEISEMHPRLQAKLLRAVQEREIDRVGGAKPVPVDVRILATSNRDLEKEVASGHFRGDLYFRLNVVNLALPPLSERPQDIPVLARHFVKKYAEANGLRPLPISQEALRLLASYDWPGNVRELENTVHRAVLLSSGAEIEPEAFGLTVRERATGASGSTAVPSAAGGVASTIGLIGRTVSDVERELIIDTLGHCLGNRTHAATILGISIRTLRNKLKLYTEEGFAVPLPGDGERSLA